MVTMNGLRVYINPQTGESADDDRIFYSRREDGPYYRWYYEDRVNHWRVARVHLKDVSSKTLCVANWKVVPVELQKSMVEHYQD